MRLPDDVELLSAYATQGSEEAFATLVEHYVSLVYSSAIRQTRDPHLAEEITQAVFIILARKAGSLDKTMVLGGWPCRTAHFTARNLLKAELRRQSHEQEAYMESVLHESKFDVWLQTAPLLDEAMAQLGEGERHAVILRFYQQKPLVEVGKILGLSADAAQKRVSRALEKLRRIFTKRGVTLSATAIAGAVSENSVRAAPAILAKSVSAVALAKGTAASSSTLILITCASRPCGLSAEHNKMHTPGVSKNSSATSARPTQETRTCRAEDEYGTLVSNYWAVHQAMAQLSHLETNISTGARQVLREWHNME